ncbi:MAG: hypothetical protein WEB58_03745 [Planctomycetaceae bacterium]
MLPIFTALLFGIFGGSAEPSFSSTDSKGDVQANADGETHLTDTKSLTHRRQADFPAPVNATPEFQRRVRSANDAHLPAVAGDSKKITESHRLRVDQPSRMLERSELALQPNEKEQSTTDGGDAGEKKDPAAEPSSDPPKSDAAEKEPKKSTKKSPSANALLKQSRKDMNSLTSIRAQLDETISFGPKRFKAAGVYIQGTELRLKLEYQLKLGASQGELLEVCDGQVLWTQQTIDNDVQVTRRDVRQILETAKNLPRSDTMMLHTELGLGGLPALLASLEETMVFKLGDRETIEKREFTLLEGRWNKEYRTIWSGGSDDPNAPLPPYVPDRVRIYMEHIRHKNRTVYFPTRVIYLKKTDPEKSIYRPIVTLEFTKIVLDGKVAEDEFVYTPREGVTPVDLTQEYLQQLKLPPRKSASASAEKAMP